MFTGIVESTGKVKSIHQNGTNLTFEIESSISSELKTDQSVSHNGVCLTVESVNPQNHRVTAIEETLKRSNLGKVNPGDLINLERCLPVNGRLDGHLVQGHVDSTAICLRRDERNGSWEFVFSYDEAYKHLIIEKGSICLNGISLTVFNLVKNEFTVAIIPYTFELTNMSNIRPGDEVNVEFDILGKYLARWKETGYDAQA